MAGVELVGAFADTLALERMKSAMPADVKKHWECQVQDRKIMGDRGCVCYLCRTIMELEKRIESWSE